MELLAILVILCTTSLLSAQSKLDSGTVFNVFDFGAVGDGKTDDSQAFTRAWRATCTDASVTPTLLIPSGKTFMLRPTAFIGPCRSPFVHVQVLGNLVAPNSIPEWNRALQWLLFWNVNGLTVDGWGKVGGQGPMWWPCRTKPHVTCRDPAPTALAFEYCNGLRLSGLHLFDNPRNHITLWGCNGAILSHLLITAPKNSPNTDGIDLGNMKDVQIYNSTIATGDDCIAILNNTFNVKMSYITCGPGHGISVGSLGRGGSYAIVEQIHVLHSTFIRTMNGVRIKTWKGGYGYVRGVSFEDILMYEVQTPVIIDELYNPQSTTGSGVRVSDVKFIGVRGTSSMQEAVKLICSDSTPCTDIVLNDVWLTPSVKGQQLTSYCQNAHGPACTTCNPKVPCLGRGT